MMMKISILAGLLAGLLSVSAYAESTSQVPNLQPELSALESEPKILHGTEGLHQGRIPLNAISPNTLKTFVSVVDLVRREYVYDVNDEKLFENAMGGMLTKLDRNAEFLSETAFNNLRSFTAGNMANIGLSAVWQSQDNHWVVTSVGEKSPSQQAGIVVGDYIHQIGETKLNESHTYNDVVQMLNGIAGTQVDVVFSKAGRSKRTATMQRTQVLQSDINTTLYDGVIVIKLPVFQNNTREQILNHLAYANAPISGIILDVRNNPGGVLESAVKVASLFMKGQVVAKVSGRHGVDKVLNTEGSPLLNELPVMVLQNRYSASAAEILASSLQTAKRALVVGETSYGKGSVQSVIPIGDNQAVKLTTAHYLTAKDEIIDGVGVAPDVVLSQMPLPTTLNRITDDNWLQQSLLLMNQAKLEAGIKFDPVGGF